MEDKVKAILADVFDENIAEINKDFNPDSVDNWDALRNLQLTNSF